MRDDTKNGSVADQSFWYGIPQALGKEKYNHANININIINPLFLFSFLFFFFFFFFVYPFSFHLCFAGGFYIKCAYSCCRVWLVLLICMNHSSCCNSLILISELILFLALMVSLAFSTLISTPLAAEVST